MGSLDHNINKEEVVSVGESNSEEGWVDGKQKRWKGN